jgi:hypothetical protein
MICGPVNTGFDRHHTRPAQAIPRLGSSLLLIVLGGMIPSGTLRLLALWAILSGGAGPVFGQTTQQVVLVDAGGLESEVLYLAGDLRPFTEGGATGQPASQTPARIVSLGAGDGRGKVLHRQQFRPQSRS